VIAKRLVDPLALGLLKGEFAAGDRIEVDAADGELQFTRSRTVAEQEAPATVA
jgi:ATP-dependent Clp protease ATP-binding subunit ClpB